MYCWALDSELPVPCEGEDEEDEGGEIRSQVSGIRFQRMPVPPALKT
jgi:hypothetical protein